MESKTSNNEKSKIVLNRKLRTWNKYRKYLIGFVGIVVVVVIFALIAKGCGSGSDNDGAKETQTDSLNTEASSEAETTTVKATEAESTTAKPTGSILKVEGSVKSEEMTFSQAFANAVFVGDFMVSGISGYDFLPDDSVFSDNAMTSDRITNYLNDIVAKSPSEVYIMIGLNDLNYGGRTIDEIYGYEKTFIEQLKAKLPTAEIYVLSVLPVSKRYNSSSNIKQTNIDALNAKLSENVNTLGVTYIDVASAFKDNEGYLRSDITDSGYNIRGGYYPFLLNGIAGVVK